MGVIKMLFVGICLIPALGCNNSAEPSSPKDITDFANHYELVYAYQNEIHTILSNGENYQQLTSDNIYDHEPVWSPDGQQIVFASAREGDINIFIMEKDGSNPTRLTHNAEGSQNARFSPDGQQLLYLSGGVLYVMNKDGSNNRAITTSNWNVHNLQLWSPDGKSIVFEDLTEIYKIDIDGGSRVRLTNNNAAEYSPSWCPHGDKIVFTSIRDGNLEIYLMNADGSNQINVSNHPARDHHPAWSPDGTKLSFVSDRDGDRDVYLMNPDGSSVINLSKDKYESAKGPRPAYLPNWSPDQTRISYALYLEQNGIHTMFIVDLETGRKFELAHGWTTPRWH